MKLKTAVTAWGLTALMAPFMAPHLPIIIKWVWDQLI